MDVFHGSKLSLECYCFELMKKLFTKTTIYILLLCGSVIFSIPFLWMTATALKPIEQTMSMPPTWIPYRYYVTLDGEKIPVIPVETILNKSILFINSEGKNEISSTQNKNGKFVKEIHATQETPWFKVILENNKSKWMVVPATSVIRKIEPRWSNFINAIKAMKFFPSYLFNTLFLCLMTVVGTVASSALAAYGFSRITWKGRNKLFIVALGTMMIPFPVVMVPLYCMFRAFGMIGTMQPLWVGSFFAQAFNVFLLRQFFMTLPKDISEAAKIDGCSEFMIFLKIILPISKPALMVVGLFQFMATWNDFLGPLIYLTDQKDFTLALGLQSFQSRQGGTEWHYLMAASILIIFPVIMLFFFTQKTFVEGISMTGTKG